VRTGLPVVAATRRHTCNLPQCISTIVAAMVVGTMNVQTRRPPDERLAPRTPFNKQNLAMKIGSAMPSVAALASVLLMTAPISAQQRPVLENGGVGKVRIGMTVEQAERMVGARLRSLVPGYGPGCWLAVRADGVDPGLSYMVENGQVTRIDVTTPQGGTAPTLATAKGIAIGSSQGDVERAYGSSARSARAPYGHDESDRWITVETTPTLGIVLSISGGKVTGLWGGRRQSIEYTEACS
jgi:hypothetical protein